ncbi:MAG: transcriptional regulator, partial [Hyphomicrobiales bacterium]|nr:transcriptional regulator [Hyphomicrobiales bacterium]
MRRKCHASTYIAAKSKICIVNCFYFRSKGSHESLIFTAGGPHAFSETEALEKYQMTFQSVSTGPARVVVIEDSEPVRQMISLYLSNNGMKVFEAGSLAAGRRAVNLLKPQVVLLDLGLEDGDGIDLLPEIVNLRIPCMVISARNEAADRILAL